MSNIKTTNLLPQVFRTDTNQKFLNATLDQLVSQPDFIKINGYIGRHLAPTTKTNDSYVPEPTTTRQNYQLEPSVVVRNKSNKIEFFGTYIDLLQQIRYLGGNVTDHDRLFANESYSYDGLFDYDKFVNFNQYYWLPEGPAQDLANPAAVDVLANGVPITEKYTVTRDTVNNAYHFSSYGTINNPTISLAHGGTYQFVVNQPGIPFWIQSQAGTAGLNFDQPGTSNRDIFGVTNNGIDVGTITFRVPPVTAQDNFNILNTVENVDFAVSVPFSQLWNKSLASVIAEFKGFDGITTSLAGRKIIFLHSVGDDEAWVGSGTFDLDPMDTSAFEPEQYIPLEDRSSVWTIHFTGTPGNQVIQFVDPQPISAATEKVFVRVGIENGNRSFYLDRDSNWQSVPNITADLPFLYYQDGAENQVNGQFKIIDPINSFIDVPNEILGKKYYVSPNGITFTNGLRIALDATSIPASYADKEFYVEGVGKSIRLVPVDILIPEWPIDTNTGTFDATTHDYITINRSSLDCNVWSRTNRWFHIDVINATANYLDEIPVVNQTNRATRPIIEFDPDIQLLNTGRKFKSIINLLELSVITHAFRQIEGMVADSSTTATITINDVTLTLTAGQKTIFGVDEDNLVRNKIYEISIIDLSDDVHVNDYRVHLSEITAGQCRDGHVVYARQVITSTGTQSLVDYWFDGSAWNYSQQKTQYNQSPLFDVLDDNNNSITDNARYFKTTFAGTKIFSYQPGTGTNDPKLGFPLSYRNFNNVGDIQFNNNFDNDTFTYQTSQLFTSQVQQNVNNFYLRLNNDRSVVDDWLPGVGYSAGDVVIYQDEYYTALEAIDPSEYFILDKNSTIPIWKKLSSTEIDNIDRYTFRNVWKTNKEPTKQYQLFSYAYSGDTNYFEIDVEPELSTGVPTIIVWLNNDVLDPANYSIVTVVGRLTVRVSVTMLTVGDLINIQVYSKNVSQLGYYEIPLNLDLNSINSKFDILTLGQIRNHLIQMSHNSNFVTGRVPGISNLRDIQIKAQGGSILQHASPVIYSDLFLLDQNINFTKSISLAQREYVRFKNKFLELSATNFNLIDLNDIPKSVDNLLAQINQVKNIKFAWYYSDMVPSSGPTKSIPYTILNPGLRRYEISNIFDDTVLSNKAILVWYRTTQKDIYGNLVLDSKDQPIILQSRQLLKGRDYIFEQDRPSVFVNDTVPLLYNDQILIVEYSDTNGSFIPETPTKLGLHPKFRPMVYTDTTYVNPVDVIQGHDGSITPTFGDYRDDLLIELESRIYNNIKVSYDTTIIDLYNYLPGKFRNSEYSIAEFNTILTQSFLKWIGNNRIDYASNTAFDSNNPFTWNYKRFVDTIDGSALPGSWRAIYKYYYDTDRPHTHPWEMLGFSEEPSWWAARYGAAPYTGGNLVLWTDLSNGYIWGEDRYDSHFARSNLLSIIPVDDAGNLRSPSEFLVANFSSTATNASWAVGDIGPAENAWRRSSDYPYAVQQAMALMKPGFYFGTLMNVDNYYINTKLNQYVIAGTNQRLTPTTVKINGALSDGTTERTVGYINWVCDYLTNLGIDPAAKIKDYLAGLNVQLGYKIAGFTDKDYLRILAEQSSPTSTNESIIVPNDNYEIYLNKSTPIQKINYSAVIVETTANGWTVSGYDNENPYFLIIPSVVNNNIATVQSGDITGVIYQDFQDYKIKVPYGFEFNQRQQVVDFLISYGRYLIGQGMSFTEFNNLLGTQQDWTLSVQEFLTWSQQGWKNGNILVISPIASQITINNNNGTVDFIENSTTGSKILDQNFTVIKNTQFTVVRNGANFKLTVNAGQMIGFAQLNVVQYEHALIFDNTTLFNDIIYKPELGNRQYRLKLIGNKTGSWNGQVDIPGFIYNNSTIDDWQAGVDYRKGSLVSYKNNYYTSLQDINATTTFISTNWQLLNANQIKTGLLANFSYNAQMLENIYDVDNQPGKKIFNQFSNGLIGFRERSYLTDLGLDVETQTKFYQGFIKQKGTQNAVNALNTVKLSNLASNITTYEEWGIRVGEYGAIDSNDYLEIVLDEEVFNSNPSSFVLLNKGQSSTDKIIGVYSDELYRRPNNYVTDILTNQDGIRTDIALPIRAGYVNLSDIDNTIFDIATYSNLNPVLSTVGSGYKIWVAKDFANEWNVYRVNETNNVVTSVAYGLGQQALITTYYDHNLEFGDVIAIKNFDVTFNGFYQVYSVVDQQSFYVVVSDSNSLLLQKEKTITGSGILYKLTSSRGSSAHDVIVNRTPPNEWKAGDTVWADDEFGTGDWATYKKETVWNNHSILPQLPSDYIKDSNYGQSVKLNQEATLAVVGSPSDGIGSVKTFTRTDASTEFMVFNGFNPVLTFTAGETPEVGASVDVGTSKIVVGAPGTYDNRGVVFVYNQTSQILNEAPIAVQAPGGSSSNDRFGSSVSISRDDRWLYVGTKPNDTGLVHAYQYREINNSTSIAVGSLDVNQQYKITTLGTTDFTKLGAPRNAVGVVFTATATGNINVGEFIIGKSYTISSAGTTDFTLLGASANTEGIVFTATATGSVAATKFVATKEYIVSSVGTTDFTAIGASPSALFDGNISGTILHVSTLTSGEIFEDAVISGTGVTAGTRIKSQITGSPGDVGTYYVSISHTETTTVAMTAQPTVGTIFTASGAGTGTGKAVQGTGTAIQGTGIVSGNFSYTFRVTKSSYPTTDLVYTINFTPNDVDSIVVRGLHKRYLRWIDYNISGNTLTFFNEYDLGHDEAGNNIFDIITVEERSYYEFIDTIIPSEEEEGGFGYSIKTTTDGEQIIIGSPQPSYYDTGGNLTVPGNTGRAVVYDRLKESFISDGHSNTFTTVRSVPATSKVTVGETVQELGVDYTVSGKVVRFHTIPADGSLVSIDINEFNKIQNLLSSTSSNGDLFGQSVDYCKNNCSVYISAPKYHTADYSYGRVVRYVNQGRVYGTITGTIESPTVSIDDSLRINGIEIVFTDTTVESVVDNINFVGIPGVSATITNDNKIKIVSDSTIAYTLLDILPGTGTAIADLGLEVFSFTQDITHPPDADPQYFGQSICVTDTAGTLLVGSSGATTRKLATVDMGSLTFDQDTTRFIDISKNSGTVYVYDYINRNDDSINTPGTFVFAQQMNPGVFSQGIKFGTSIAAKNGFALVGAPKDSNSSLMAGDVYVYTNPANAKSWSVIRRRQAKVDLKNLLRMLVYNKRTHEIQTSLDLYDPANGKILGTAEQELDYISTYDPAQYNSNNPQIDTVYPELATDPSTAYKFVYVGTVSAWGKEQVGQLWWNLDAVRYIDYEQDSLTYRSRNWGGMFPGSTIEICEWVESDLPPSSYSGSGTVKFIDGTQYSLSYYVDITGVIRTKYYFWVVNKTVANTVTSHKTKSAYEIAKIIQYPQTSGISYAAAIRSDAFNLYGIGSYLSGTDSVLQLSYSIVNNQNIIHSEYELVKEGSSLSTIPEKIINKIMDSLTGSTIDGFMVPDPRLPENQKIGIDTRPRQSMFVDRILALENFVQYVNSILAVNPIVLEFTNDLFYKADPYPVAESGAWDIKVDYYEALDYIDKNLLPVGYRILVVKDTRQDELWTINELDSNGQFIIIQIQAYRTERYIDQVDWYDSSFDTTQPVNYITDNLNDIEKLSLVSDEIIRVNNEGSGRYAYYSVNSDLSLKLVGLEKGTIQISNTLYDPTAGHTTFDGIEFDSGRFDEAPVNEIRNIFEAIYKDIFIKELSVEFNNLFFNLVNYILTEQKNVEWIFKSSFISVIHKIRKLVQYPNYVRDNQTYYEDYINEVKPYRTQIREYLLDYEGLDTFGGNVTDFDLSSYYNKNTGSFYSPTVSDLTDATFLSTISSSLKQQYSYWYNNYTFQVADIVIVDPGVNYTVPPSITLVGGGGTGATAVASIDYADNTISSIQVTSPGKNYTSAPTVIINGNGSRTTGANIVLTVDEGVITSATIVNPGHGFTRTPRIFVVGDGIGANIVCNINTISGTISDVTINDGGLNFTSANAVVADYNSGATAQAVIRNVYYKSNPAQSYNTVRNIQSTLKFDRISYTSNVKQWSANAVYYSGDTVSHQGDAWRATETVYPTATLALSGNISVDQDTVIGILNSTGRANVGMSITNSNVLFVSNTIGTLQAGTTSWLYQLDPATYSFTNNLGVRVFKVTSVFDVTKYDDLNTGDFDNANDRTMGYYTPGPGMVAKDLPQIFSGIEYPGVKVTGPAFDSNIAVTTDVLEFFATNSTIRTTDITSFNFTKVDMPLNANVKITGSEYNNGYWIVNIVDDNRIVVRNAVGTALADESPGSVLTLTYYNQNNPSYLDSSIQSDYLDTALGTRPEDINVDGGAYIDRFSSHAPEELVPGRIYDNLNMEVWTKLSFISNVGYRISHGMNADPQSTNSRLLPQYHRISKSNVTVLTYPLRPSDTQIQVLDARVLATPGRDTAHPGIIYINGEKIHYYRNLLDEVIPWKATKIQISGDPDIGPDKPEQRVNIGQVSESEVLVMYSEDAIVSYEGNVYQATGNISGLTFNFANVVLFDPNVLRQITRGVDGTGIPMEHSRDTLVVDASLDQKLSGNVHYTTWLNMTDDQADGTGLLGSTTEQAMFIKEPVPKPLPAPTAPEDKQPPLK